MAIIHEKLTLYYTENTTVLKYNNNIKICVFYEVVKNPVHPEQDVWLHFVFMSAFDCKNSALQIIHGQEESSAFCSLSCSNKVDSNRSGARSQRRLN